MSVTVTTPDEPAIDAEAVHHAATAAIVEAEHREDTEEAIEAVAEEVDSWQAQTTAHLLSMRSELTALQMQVSALTTAQAAIVEEVADVAEEAAAETSEMEEEILQIENDEQTSETSSETPPENSNPPRKSQFYSPLRSLSGGRRSGQ